MISLLTVLTDGTSIEAMTVGYEGMVGLSIFHRSNTARERALCQIDADAYRLSATTFAKMVDNSSRFRAVMHKYAQLSQDSLAQSAACNSVHLVEKRCARWLLLSADAAGDDEFNLTQEFLAQMLAVRRSGVTEALGSLERGKLIKAGYGKIAITDRAGLEKMSCECYGTMVDRRRELLD